MEFKTITHHLAMYSASKNRKHFTMLLTFVILFFAFPSLGQVTTLQNWTNVYHGTATTAQATAITVPAGTNANRLIAVAIASDMTGVGARTVTITYGGKAFTLANGNMAVATIQQHTALYYLLDTDIRTAVGNSLSVTVSGGTTRMTDVWWAAFDYVNQTTPITNSQTYNSGISTVSTFQFATALTVNANNQAVLVVSNDRTGSTTLRTTTYPTNWTMVNEQTLAATDAIRNGVANRSIPTINTTDLCATTFSGTALAAMTGMSINCCTNTTANAGSALSAICKGGTSAALGGSTSSGTGTWSDGGVGGTFNPNATTLNATYTPPAAYTGTVTLTLTASGATCATNGSASKTLVVNPQPAATISYSISTVCNSVLAAQAVTITGTTGGTFTSTPAGLSINSSTGAINPSSSFAGDYTITYAIAASGGCNATSTSTSITVVNDQNTISYSSLSFCSNYAGAVNVTRNAPTGGTYSSSPAGLSINTTTGAVNVLTSLVGNYTVTYNFSGGACSNSTSTSLAIKPNPNVTCPANTGTCSTAPSFTLTGGSPFGGTYSGSGVSGGNFNPASVVAGTYPITYTYNDPNGCSASCTFNMSVTNGAVSATATPVNDIVYSGNAAVINMTSTVPGIQYTWTVSTNNPNVTGFSAQASPVPGPINQVLTNSSPLIGNVTYTITPQLIGCSGTPSNVVISLPSTTFCQSPGTFQKGSCIIDMGVVPQTYANGLKPYGLIYELLNVYKVPVYWAINPSKSFETTLPKVDEADFTVDGLSFKGGSFIVPAAFMSVVQTTINNWVSQGVQVYYTQSSFNPPVYEELTHIPKVVLDVNTGALIESGFYVKAGIPTSAYTKGGIPSAITNCDDIYVLPHADPSTWTQAMKDSLLNFINQRGWLFTSCYAVSGIENLPGMNFLSNGGLVAYNSHVHPATGAPLSYSLGAGIDATQIAADPYTQFVKTMDGAVNTYALERVYVPKPAGWRSTTRIAAYYANYANAGITYPNNAAALAYGRAFGDINKGMVLYLAGHDFERGTIEENVAMARVYANFLLRSGIGTRPKINPVSIPATALAGQTINLSVSIPPSTSPIVTTEWTSDLNGIFSSMGASTTFTPPGVDHPSLCTVQFKVTDACGRVATYCSSILINPTITNNYIGTAQTICAGSTPATLFGSAPAYNLGNNFTYQWLISTTGAASGFTAAPGVSNQQNFTSLPLTQTSWIRRQVTCNGVSVISTSIQIIVTPGPVVSTQPSTATQSICGGGTYAAISVASTDAPVTYQWYTNTVPNNTTGTSIITANSSSLTPPSNTGVTNYYYCGITNALGCTTYSAVSGAFITSVPLTSITSNISTAAQTVCQGQPITPLSITVNGGAAQYRWYHNTTASNTGGVLDTTIVSGASTSTFTPTLVGSFYYYCWIAPASGCGASIIRSPVSGLITIKPLPTAGITNNTGTTVITCSNRTIAVTATGGTSYNWSNGLGANATVSLSDTGRYTVTVTGANGCSAPANITITSGITGSTWTGASSAAWNNEDNWCGKIPSDTSSVIIPAGTPNDPVISGAVIAKVKNITLLSGATLYLDGEKLQVYGSINSNANINAVNGDIELAGNISSQSISGSMFMAHRIKNLKLSNSNGITFNGTNDTVRITGALEFGNSNVVLTTNDNLTLASDINGTARVGDLTMNGTYAGNKILGNVTVERYVPNHTKAWQFLAAPTTGQTIKAAWQEGNTAMSAAINPGYGTIITSNMGGSTAGATALGFDMYTSAGGTLKTYDGSTDTWTGVASTNNLIDNAKGYMLFVRGDRSVIAYNQAATATTLRTTGVLYQPNITAPATTNVLADKYESVGNPYASAIDVSKIIRTGGVQDIYYVWDPKLTTSVSSVWGLGGYQTIYKNGATYTVIPGGGSYANGNVNIQSGQAFLVHAVGAGGTVSFNETCKTTGSNLFTRETTENTSLFTRLYGQTVNDTALLDGALSLYDASFTNEINEYDALKMSYTSSENISLLRGLKKLTAEQRSSILTTDTVFYQLNGLRRQTYLLKLSAHNFSADGVSGKLIDKYLNTVTPINPEGDFAVSFSVTTDVASAASDRFMVVFENMGTLPVTFTSIKATRLDKSKVVVDWKTENAMAISHYEIQKSTDGRNFSSWENVLPNAGMGSSASYSNIDLQAQASLIYYRVKSIGLNGSIQYSAIVKVNNIAELPKAYVYPNPVENKLVNVYFENMSAGNYMLTVQDASGKKLTKQKVSITTVNEHVIIKLSANTATGCYWLTISGDNGFVERQKILIQ